MIQTLNTLSLIFAILAVVMVIISVMIFFNWKIREVRGYLTGKTKADVLANLREETDSQKRYAMNTEMFTSQISTPEERTQFNESTKQVSDSPKTSAFDSETSFIAGEEN